MPVQLCQYLPGEDIKTIENLGHSPAAYQIAKERLERKFGGQRRQMAIYLGELLNMRSVRFGNSRDMEQFVDILDININLKENGNFGELADGSLYKTMKEVARDNVATVSKMDL